MKRITTGLTLATALLGFTLAGTALGQNSNTLDGYDAPPQAKSFGGYQNNGGPWGGHGQGHGRFNRATFDGRWVADNRSADTRYGGFGGNGGFGGIRDMLLPGLIEIDQHPRMLKIEDARNHVLQQIMIGGRFNPRGGSDLLVGHWDGPMTLVVERMGPRGAKLTQTFSLENRGRSLVVRTSREGRGPRGTVQFTTVYHRA
jgi:hypothetical protein